MPVQDERDRVFDEKTVAADMIDFLAEFREAHPEYFDVPLYVTGESYAGQIEPLHLSALLTTRLSCDHPPSFEWLAMNSRLCVCVCRALCAGCDSRHCRL